MMKIKKAKPNGLAAKTDQETKFANDLLANYPKLSTARCATLWVNYSQDTNAVCCEILKELNRKAGV